MLSNGGLSRFRIAVKKRPTARDLACHGVSNLAIVFDVIRPRYQHLVRVVCKCGYLTEAERNKHVAFPGSLGYFRGRWRKGEGIDDIVHQRWRHLGTAQIYEFELGRVAAGFGDEKFKDLFGNGARTCCTDGPELR